jgi:hypothetical protein
MHPGTPLFTPAFVQIASLLGEVRWSTPFWLKHRFEKRGTGNPEFDPLETF